MTAEDYAALMQRSELGFALYFLAVAGILWLIYQAARIFAPAGAWRRFPDLYAHSYREAKIWSWLPFPAIWLALAVGFCVRLIQINDVLWYDETFTAAIARLPDLERLFTVVRGDVHPPTNYVLTWLVVQLFGDSELALRLPALLAGTLLIYLAYRLALALRFSSKAAHLSAWMMVFMPAAIEYSTEARQYALLACFVFGAAIVLLEGRGRWFFFLAGALPWIHNLGFFYAGLLCLAALLYHGKSAFRTVLLTGLLAATWLPAMLYQSSDVADGFWIPQMSLAGLIYPLASMTISGDIPLGLVLLSYTPWLCVMIAAFAWSRRWLVTRRGLVWLALFVGVPVSIAVVSWLWRPVYLHRALLPASLAVIPLVAQFLTNKAGLRRFWQGFAAVGLGIAFLGFLHPVQGHNNNRSGLDVVEHCAGADLIINTSLSLQFVSTYYLPHTQSLMTPAALDLNQQLPGDALQALGFEFGNLDDLSGDVCIIEVLTPMVIDRDQVTRTVKDNPPLEHRSTHVEYNEVFAIVFHRLRFDR